MKMTLHSTSAEEMANGFRQFSLCLPFESLLLQGPDRNFSIRGVLV
jgi:hypothetical protein